MGAAETTSMMSMGMPLLPEWLRIVWVVALCVVFLLHVWHLLSMSGLVRWWHVGHAVMAASMIVMYVVSQAVLPDTYPAGVVLFGVLTTGMASVSIALWRRDRLLNRLWAASTVDMLAMTYMALPAADQPAAVTYLFVAYLCAEVLVWLANPLRRARLRRLPAARNQRVLRPQPVMGAAGAELAKSPQAGESPWSGDGSQPERAVTCESARLFADVTVGVRLTVTVMAASMAYMFIAMQTMQAHMTPVMPVMPPMMPMH